MICLSNRATDELKRTLTKANHLSKVPPIPVVSQGFMTCSRCHFSNASRKGIGMRPTGFDFFAACPSDSFHVPEIKFTLTIGTVTFNMPTRNSTSDIRRLRDSHVLRELLHSLLEVLGPLACNIIRDDQHGQHNSYQRGENDEVHVTISGIEP